MRWPGRTIQPNADTAKYASTASDTIMAPTNMPPSAPLGAWANAGAARAEDGGVIGEVPGSSRLSRTAARGDSGAAGLAEETWTREVSFFGLGAVTGVPMTAVSFLDSSSGAAAGLGAAG